MFFDRNLTNDRHDIRETPREGMTKKWEQGDPYCCWRSRRPLGASAGERDWDHRSSILLAAPLAGGVLNYTPSDYRTVPARPRSGTPFDTMRHCSAQKMGRRPGQVREPARQQHGGGRWRPSAAGAHRLVQACTSRREPLKRKMLHIENGVGHSVKPFGHQARQRLWPRGVCQGRVCRARRRCVRARPDRMHAARRGGVGEEYDRLHKLLAKVAPQDKLCAS